MATMAGAVPCWSQEPAILLGLLHEWQEQYLDGAFPGKKQEARLILCSRGQQQLNLPHCSNPPLTFWSSLEFPGASSNSACTIPSHPGPAMSIPQWLTNSAGLRYCYCQTILDHSKSWGGKPVARNYNQRFPWILMFTPSHCPKSGTLFSPLLFYQILPMLLTPLIVHSLDALAKHHTPEGWQIFQSCVCLMETSSGYACALLHTREGVPVSSHSIIFPF